MQLRRSRRIKTLGIALIASLVIVGCGTSPARTTSTASSPAKSVSGSSAQRPQVVIAYSSPTAAQAAVWVAKDDHFFSKYGLNAQVKQVVTKEQIAAVNAGEIAFGGTSADNIESAILAGAKLKLIGLVVPYVEMRFFGVPSVKTAQQLRGKLVAFAGSGPGIVNFGTYYALKKLGLDPHKDVQLRAFKEGHEAFIAAKAGEVQAVGVFPPDDVAAQRAGFHLLYNVAKDHVLYPSLSYYTSDKIISNHPTEVLDFMKAISAGIAAYKSDPSASETTFVKWSGEKDPVISRRAVQWFSGAAPVIPEWSTAAIKASLKQLSLQLPKAATANPTSFYDNSFIQQLIKQGFYSALKKEYPVKNQ